MTPEILKKANEFDKKIKGFKMAANVIREFAKRHEDDRRCAEPDKGNKLKTFIISAEKGGNKIEFTGDDICLDELIDLNELARRADSLAESYKKDLEKL